MAGRKSAAFLDLGLEPTHLDGHHHVHVHPQLWSVTRALVREFDLPIRAMPPGWEAGAALCRPAEIRHPQVCLVDFTATACGKSSSPSSLPITLIWRDKRWKS